jgi:hypothetical protein
VGVDELIKDKKYIYFAIIPFLTSMALNFPFPNENLPGGTVSIFNIPVKSVKGIHFVGISSLFLLIVSLYLLVKSLNKYHIRIVLAAIMVANVTPPFVATLYQKNFSTGIYAISYQLDKSKCSFEMTNETILHGVCELPFENYSRNDVRFTIEFYKHYPFEDEVQMLSLMNSNAPYYVKIRGNERKLIKIETDIEASKMKGHMDSGEATGVNIIIKSRERIRKL